MGKKKILLLSDGSGIFPVMARFFTAEGYQVTTSGDSRGALAAMRAGDFQLLITRMPHRPPELAAALKSMRKRTPWMTAIILRGDHEINSPLEAYQVKGDEEVFIPCGWPGLRRLVNGCLNA